MTIVHVGGSSRLGVVVTSVDTTVLPDSLEHSPDLGRDSRQMCNVSDLPRMTHDNGKTPVRGQG